MFRKQFRLMTWFSPGLRRFAAFVAGCVVAGACAPASPAVVVPSTAVWHPAAWVQVADSSGPWSRVGIVMRDVRRGAGADAPFYQLDFSGNGQRPLGLPIVVRSTAESCELSGRKLTGLRADTPAERITLDFGGDSLLGATNLSIGTLGLPSIAAQTVVLDMLHHRMAIVPRDGGAVEDRRVRWSAAMLEDDRLLVQVSAEAREPIRAILDLGTLPFPALASAERWTMLTGRRASDPRNRVVRVPACGGQLTIVLAPPTSPLRLGSLRLAVGEIATIVDAPASLDVSAWPRSADLMLGAEAIAREGVVVIEMARGRVGVVR